MAKNTDKSINELLHHSFTEMLRLLKPQQECITRECKPEFIQEKTFNTIMFTVSSSNFRLVVLLHFQPKNEVTAATLQDLGLDPSVSRQHYHDYTCELGNNFCGIVCRVLGNAGFSTGMSTPVILANANSIANMRSVGINYETHIQGQMGDAIPFCASMFLFFNKGHTENLDIPIPAAQEEENLGELEFF